MLNIYNFSLIAKEGLLTRSCPSVYLSLCTVRWFEEKKYIFKESALGRFFHRVAMSVYVSIYLSPFHVIYFEASHWPSGHMIRSRPLIG